jgi:hypothetical protein
MNQEILEVKQALIDDVIEYMKYGGAVDENDPEYDPEFDAGYMQKPKSADQGSGCQSC